jgi:hypothetical protein
MHFINTNTFYDTAFLVMFVVEMDRMAELGLGERKTTRMSIDRWLYRMSRLKLHLTATVGLPTHINV